MISAYKTSVIDPGDAVSAERAESELTAYASGVLASERGIRELSNDAVYKNIGDARIGRLWMEVLREIYVLRIRFVFEELVRGSGIPCSVVAVFDFDGDVDGVSFATERSASRFPCDFCELSVYPENKIGRPTPAGYEHERVLT